MHQHGPDPLVGPLRGANAWWHSRPADTPPTPEPAPAARVRKRGPRKIRTDLVKRVRAEIEAGTYDTPERFQAALETMFEKLWD
ncbi:MAG: hypothetical protein WCL32_01410 [Planctomycetota bacterium]